MGSVVGIGNSGDGSGTDFALAAVANVASFVNVDDFLGDVGGIIADACEVLGNLHRHRDQPQVAGQWRLGEKGDGHVVDFYLQFVEQLVLLLGVARIGVVALDEGFHGTAHGGFGEAPHG